jgi:predicted esterase
MGAALSAENRCLIMLHGLGRSANSLWVVEQFFRACDYQVYRLGDPSTQKILIN